MPYVNLTQLDIDAVRAIREYGTARARFRRVQDELKEARLLVGNDNKVGIAGEYWALRFYRSRGYELDSLPRFTNNADFDFIVKKSGRRAHVSVKTITDENRRGTTTLVRGGGKWDELCLVILTEDLMPKEFGVATKREFRAHFRKCKDSQPANRRWLRQNWMSVATPTKN